MVVTRSRCPECQASGGRHNARNHNRGTDAAIRRDAARAAAGHRTSARSRGKKSARALQPHIPREDTDSRAHRRTTVPTRNTTTRHGGREATRKHSLYLAPGRIRN